MRISFLSPPVGKINGGIKYIFRMADSLRAAGHEAVVVEKDKNRPGWFASSAPILGIDELGPRAGEILVLPEDQPGLLQTVAAWPQRKIIYCQNHFYAAIGALGTKSFADYGVTDILCGSQTIAAYCAARHPGLTTHIIPCGVDAKRFHPAAKQPAITLLPRKRVIEAVYLQDMFRHQYPQWRSVQWQELANAHEDQIAAALSQAAVFLSLSRLDGFGLTPIEAMAADCVVAGFTGIGGREYATPENGFWAAEDDFPACLQALDQALTLWQKGGSPLAARHAAARATAAQYSPERFDQATLQAWANILFA